MQATYDASGKTNEMLVNGELISGFGGDAGMVAFGWWQVASLVWTQKGVDEGSGYFPGIQTGDLVTESQRAAAASFGGDEAMINNFGWWEYACD